MYEHHRRYDGKGYPQVEGGVTAGRIVAVTDVYDALTSNRPCGVQYDGGLIEFMLDKVGKDFDGRVVEILFKVKGWEYPTEMADARSQQSVTSP